MQAQRYDEKIATRFKEPRLVPNGKTINQYKWEQLVYDDDTFNEEFQRVFNKPNVPEADNLTPDTHDGYQNMEVELDKGGDNPKMSRVVKRAEYNEVNTIVVFHQNPIIDTRIYEL